MDQLLAALGHPLRLRIARLLLDAGGLRHGVVASRLEVRGGTLTKALGELEDAGLVVLRDRGYQVVDPERLRAVLAAAAHLSVSTAEARANRASREVEEAKRVASDFDNG